MRRGKRHANLKKEKKKRTILQTVPAVAKSWRMPLVCFPLQNHREQQSPADCAAVKTEGHKEYVVTHEKGPSLNPEP